MGWVTKYKLYPFDRKVGRLDLKHLTEGVRMREFDVQNAMGLMNKLIGDADLEFSNPTYRTKFNYTLCRNLKELQKHMDILQEVKDKDEKWKEYNVRLIALCEKYSQIEGSNVIKDSIGFKFNNACMPFMKEKEELSKLYADHLYDNDIEIQNIYKIKQEWLPINKSFLGAYVMVLEPFIESESDAV